MPDSEVVDDATVELIHSIELIDIDVIRLNIDIELSADDADFDPNQAMDAPLFSIGIDLHDEEKKARFRVRLRMNFEDAGELDIEMGAVYDLGKVELDDLPEGVIMNFFNKVVVMALFPYLRSEVSYLTGKAFKQPYTLPVMKQGELVFGGEDEEE